MPGSEYSPQARELLTADAQVADYELRARKRNADFFARFLRWLPPDAGCALDVGCGSGRLTAALATRMKCTVGVDISPVMLELARERAPHSCWVRADANALPFAAASFDFVVSSNALRLTDLTRSLPQIARALTPGGALAIRDVYHNDYLKPFHLAGYLAWSLRRAFDAWRVFGSAVSLNLLRHLASPAVIAARRAAETHTPTELRALYEAAFPGCQWSWETNAFFVTWTKPKESLVG